MCVITFANSFRIVSSFRILFISVTIILLQLRPWDVVMSKLSDEARVRRDRGVRSCGVRTSTSVDHQRQSTWERSTRQRIPPGQVRPLIPLQVAVVAFCGR